MDMVFSVCAEQCRFSIFIRKFQQITSENGKSNREMHENGNNLQQFYAFVISKRHFIALSQFLSALSHSTFSSIVPFISMELEMVHFVCRHSKKILCIGLCNSIVGTATFSIAFKFNGFSRKLKWLFFIFFFNLK